MALNNTLPFGLRDVKITPLGATGLVVGAEVDLPAARTFSFADAETFSTLTGDDTTMAMHGDGPTVEWSLEEGGISLEAYAAIAGGTVGTAGITPNQIKTFYKLQSDQRPYFRVEGQAISDSGGDFHVVVFRCKADGNLTGEMAGGAFWLTGCSGKGYGNLIAGADVNKLYALVQNETATAIA